MNECDFIEYDPRFYSTHGKKNLLCFANYIASNVSGTCKMPFYSYPGTDSLSVHLQTELKIGFASVSRFRSLRVMITDPF